MAIKMIPGPDPNPIKPSVKLPPGACDAHCHVFGPGDRFPYHPNRAYTPPDAGKEALKKLHDHLGIERAVIVHASCHGPDMRATLDGIKRSNGRFRGTAIIDENYTTADFDRMHEGGIRGVRFNFVKHLGGRPDFNFFHKTVDRLKALGWHLILHLDANDIVEFEDMFRKLPVPMVIDHMARVSAKDGLEQKPFKVLLDFMKDEKVWVKVCGSERVSSGGPPFHDAIPSHNNNRPDGVNDADRRGRRKRGLEQAWKSGFARISRGARDKRSRESTCESQKQNVAHVASLGG